MYLCTVLLLAIWAINGYRNELWAGINVAVVAVGPLLIAVASLAVTGLDMISSLSS